LSRVPLVWPRKDHIARNRGRRENKRKTEGEVGKQQEWTTLEFADSQRATRDRER